MSFAGQPGLRAQALAALSAELSDLRPSQDPVLLEARSRDYYWYSPILKEQLDPCRGELLVRAASESEVIRVAAACARHHVPLTIRGGGTGNYGQCVPLEGGVILDLTALDRVLEIRPGSVRMQAGALIMDIERAVRASTVVEGGQELLMYPSTRNTATIGGFIGGGYGGAGSVRNGILKDPGNVTRVRVVTVEESPRVIELLDAEIQKVHHAYGTNGIMTELDLALNPAVDWVHHIALFHDYRSALAFGVAATEACARANPLVDRPRRNWVQGLRSMLLRSPQSISAFPLFTPRRSVRVFLRTAMRCFRWSIRVIWKAGGL